MAIKIQTYWKTNQIDEERLQKSIKSCKKQDQRVLELFKHYQSLTDNDIYGLYTYYFGEVKQSSTERSRHSLFDSNIIEQGEMVMGPYDRPNRVYHLKNVNNPIVKPKRIPQSISIKIIYDENGKIDCEKMFDKTAKELDKIINKYNL